MKVSLSLTRKQTEFIDTLFFDNFDLRTDNKFTEFYFFGGFGSGKSRTIYTATNILCQKYPNSHGVFIRGTFPELKDSVIPQFMSCFPAAENRYKYYETDRNCLFENGTRLDFRAFDKDTKIFSNEYDFIVYSQLEEINEELFLHSLGRNRRRVGGLPKNIILGEGNPSGNWVKRRVKDERPDNVYLLESKTKDNPFLPDDYEANLRKNYPAFWIARFVDGEWTNLDEAVFSEFREKEQVVELSDPQFLNSFKKRAGLDYGWVNPTAIVFGFTDNDGSLTIFDEWGGVQKTPAEISEAANQYGKMPIVADYSIKRPDRDGRSLWEDLSDAGLWLEESNKQELENITLANTLLKTGRLKITKNCVNLIREIQNYRWKKIKLGAEKNRPEEPVQKDNHYIDAMLYLIASLEELRTVDYKAEKAKTKTIGYLNTHKPRGHAMLKNS